MARPTRALPALRDPQGLDDQALVRARTPAENQRSQRVGRGGRAHHQQERRRGHVVALLARARCVTTARSGRRGPPAAARPPRGRARGRRSPAAGHRIGRRSLGVGSAAVRSTRPGSRIWRARPQVRAVTRALTANRYGPANGGHTRPVNGAIDAVKPTRAPSSRHVGRDLAQLLERVDAAHPAQVGLERAGSRRRPAPPPPRSRRARSSGVPGRPEGSPWLSRKASMSRTTAYPTSVVSLAVTVSSPATPITSTCFQCATSETGSPATPPARPATPRWPGRRRRG